MGGPEYWHKSLARIVGEISLSITRHKLLRVQFDDWIATTDVVLHSMQEFRKGKSYNAEKVLTGAQAAPDQRLPEERRQPNAKLAGDPVHAASPARCGGNSRRVARDVPKKSRGRGKAK